MYNSTVIPTFFNTTLIMKDLTDAGASTSANNSDDNGKLAMPNAVKCNVRNSGQEHDARPKRLFPCCQKKVNSVMPSWTSSC